jgi:hypothetical protein
MGSGGHDVKEGHRSGIRDQGAEENIWNEEGCSGRLERNCIIRSSITCTLPVDDDEMEGMYIPDGAEKACRILMGGRSVGVVRLRTEGHGVCFCLFDGQARRKETNRKTCYRSSPGTPVSLGSLSFHQLLHIHHNLSSRAGTTDQ